MGEKPKPNKIRRRLLLSSAAISSTLVGIIPASGKRGDENQRTNDPPRNFDPSNQEAARRAAHKLLRIESREKAEQTFRKYSAEQQKAMKKPLLESSVEIEAEVEG